MTVRRLLTALIMSIFALIGLSACGSDVPPPNAELQATHIKEISDRGFTTVSFADNDDPFGFAPEYIYNAYFGDCRVMIKISGSNVSAGYTLRHGNKTTTARLTNADATVMRTFEGLNYCNAGLKSDVNG